MKNYNFSNPPRRIHINETIKNKEIPHFASLPARLRQSGGHSE